MKHFVFFCLLSTAIMCQAKNDTFTPETTQNIQQTVYWGVIVETIKNPIKDFLTHQNSHLLKIELEKSSQLFHIHAKEYVSIIALLLLQPDMQKKLAIYSEQEQKKVLQSLFSVVDECLQENVHSYIESAIEYLLDHAS